MQALPQCSADFVRDHQVCRRLFVPGTLSASRQTSAHFVQGPTSSQQQLLIFLQVHCCWHTDSRCRPVVSWSTAAICMPAAVKQEAIAVLHKREALMTLCETDVPVLLVEEVSITAEVV